jgi:hypothetical protein
MRLTADALSLHSNALSIAGQTLATELNVVAKESTPDDIASEFAQAQVQILADALNTITPALKAVGKTRATAKLMHLISADAPATKDALTQSS